MYLRAQINWNPLFRSRSTVSFGAAALRSALAVAMLACIAVGILGCGNGINTSAGSQTSVAPTASALGPQLGYLWMDSDHTLRPILGIPGASQVGQSVVSAGTYTGAVTSASVSLAILQGSDGSFDLMRLPAGSPSSLGLTLPSGARLRLSPTAAAALLYTPGASSASLITGLPSGPQVQSVSAPGPITDSAISDTGTAAFEYAQGTKTTVAVSPAGGHSVPVASIGLGGGLAFLPGHDDLLFADRSANTLTLVRSSSSTPSNQTLAGGALNAPVAVGVSHSGRWAVVANSGSKSLSRVDLSSFTAVSVACGCQPTVSEALADDGAFRLTSLSSGPNWIVDAAAATPRVLFIPALPGSAAVSASMIAAVAHP